MVYCLPDNRVFVSSDIKFLHGVNVNVFEFCFAILLGCHCDILREMHNRVDSCVTRNSPDMTMQAALCSVLLCKLTGKPFPFVCCQKSGNHVAIDVKHFCLSFRWFYCSRDSRIVYLRSVTVCCSAVCKTTSLYASRQYPFDSHTLLQRP